MPLFLPEGLMILLLQEVQVNLFLLELILLGKEKRNSSLISRWDKNHIFFKCYLVGRVRYFPNHSPPNNVGHLWNALKITKMYSLHSTLSLLGNNTSETWESRSSFIFSSCCDLWLEMDACFRLDPSCWRVDRITVDQSVGSLLYPPLSLPRRHCWPICNSSGFPASLTSAKSYGDVVVKRTTVRGDRWG